MQYLFLRLGRAEGRQKEAKHYGGLADINEISGGGNNISHKELNFLSVLPGNSGR